LLIQHRKADHIRVCLREQVEFQTKTTVLERYEFVHQALPEINKDEIDISMTLFGKTLDAPIIIEAMTGGTDLAYQINENLAYVAQRLRIGKQV